MELSLDLDCKYKKRNWAISKQNILLMYKIILNSQKQMEKYFFQV